MPPILVCSLFRPPGVTIFEGSPTGTKTGQPSGTSPENIVEVPPTPASELPKAVDMKLEQRPRRESAGSKFLGKFRSATRSQCGEKIGILCPVSPIAFQNSRPPFVTPVGPTAPTARQEQQALPRFYDRRRFERHHRVMFNREALARSV